MASPSSSSTHHVTALLKAWGQGDASALDALLPTVYGELHRQAERCMRGQSAGHTLQATALVHEAYLKLVDQATVEWRSRAQFYGVAAKAMRSILIDHARARRAAKRGAGATRVTLATVPDVAGKTPVVDVLELDEALQRFAELDPDKARLVELRYFGGLSIMEVSEVLELSPATVKRQWTTARAWLRRELTPG
jgi:RNA polymerase sigma factor (TIGR02999 family)